MGPWPWLCLLVPFGALVACLGVVRCVTDALKGPCAWPCEAGRGVDGWGWGWFVLRAGLGLCVG